MKKQIGLALTSISLFLMNPISASAATLCPSDANGGGAFANLCGSSDPNSLAKLIGGFITIIFIVVTIVALFYLIWGGFKWLTSGGDSKAVDSARGHIIAAIIGLIIIFLSYFILNFVLRIFVPNFSINNFTLPSISF
jgi:hypothetical protein